MGGHRAGALGLPLLLALALLLAPPTAPFGASTASAVDTEPPETFIDSFPPEPSSGFEAHFTFHSSEPNSSFRCQLDSGAYQTCSEEAGRTYFGLADGVHAFRVYAIDNVGNEDPTPAEHAFTVDTSIGDTTPPDTRILSAPPDPSHSSEAAFAYSSSEAGATFQCSLDSAPFAACPASGATYRGLANGAHGFAVRSVDRAGNTDPSPATYAWAVAAPVPDTRFTRAPGPYLRSKRGGPVTVSFGFAAEPPAASFRCRLDLRGPYKPCASPYRIEAKPGRHVFEVFAIDALGNEEGTPALRIFAVAAPGPQRAFFAQSGRLLSSLGASIVPSALPRRRLRPVSLRLSSSFENLDGTDTPALKAMTLRLAAGGVVQSAGLPRCKRRQLAQRSTAQALAACRAALVGRGTVDTALRFPEGARQRSAASLLLFNAPGGILMHVYTRTPIEGTFVIPFHISHGAGASGTVLSARFPAIATGYGQVTGFQMTIHRTYSASGARRSYLLASCPAPPGFGRIAFQLAQVDYRFRGGLRIENSTINTCRVAR